jgi:8-oxo-dGTP pyrophosphatase MutT (NUDIX family)
MSKEGAIIIFHDPLNRIAWQLRDDKPDIDDPNRWGLFGGWIESGEYPREAILREMKGELSITLELSKLEYLGNYRIYPEVIAHVFVYFVTDGFHNAILNEGQRWQFMTIDETRSKNVIPADFILADWYINKRGRSLSEIQNI